MKRLFLTLFTMVTGLALTGIAYGATTGGTLAVSTTISVACDVSTTAVAFGTDSGSTTVTANGSITVNCSNGATYNIALNKGLNKAVLGSSRRLISSSTDYVSYALYEDSGLLTQWGDSDFANTYANGGSKSGTGNGSDQVLTVYGKRFAGPSTGTFTDTVAVTIHF